MIKHFQSIKNVGCYDDFTFDPDLLNPFGRINILYGNNGSGKTTFSNLLFLLSKHCKDKSQLLSELLDEASEFEVITDSGKVTHKSIAEKSLDLYVFNTKFINDHVYNGTTANIDSFSSSSKLTSPEIQSLEMVLKNISNRDNKMKQWISASSEKIESIYKLYNEEFQQKVSNARLTNVKPTVSKKGQGDLIELKLELKNLYIEYAKKNKETNVIEKIEELKIKISGISNLDLEIDDIAAKLKSTIVSDSKGKIASRISFLQEKVDQKKFQNPIGDLTQWLKTGGRLLYLTKGDHNHCPLCDANLADRIHDILLEFTSYFSNTILALHNTIDKAVSDLDKFVNGNQINLNQLLIDDLIHQCEQNYNITVMPLNDYGIDEVALNGSVIELITLLKLKKKETESELEIDGSLLKNLTSYRMSINEFKSAFMGAIEKEVTSLKTKNIDSIVKDIKTKIGLICTLEYNLGSNNIFKSKRKTNSDISLKCEKLKLELGKMITELGVKRSGEISKLNSESKYINLYLSHFGIDNFNIDRVKDKAQDNLIITYSKTGKRKTKLSHSLSEGEKTALAFAYFISKLRVEKIEGDMDVFLNTIIVIDDPISSLDDNRLFQTANLIDSFLFYNTNESEQGKVEGKAFSICPKQVFILSHNLTFVKYLHNALKGNAKIKEGIEEYYLSKEAPRIRRLPTGLKNFTNTYIIKLKEIIDFKDKKIQYDVAKNYLPNYIRIVLETFLSFKLAMVNDSAERLPGLSHLIKGMVKEFDNFDDLTIGDLNKDAIVKRLNHLKKIADHESHGSIYKAEEFSFISEDELKVFAKNTLQIINYLDRLHFNKVKGHFG